MIESETIIIGTLISRDMMYNSVLWGTKNIP